MITDPQTLQAVIDKMEEDLSELKQQRKKRSDKGVKRKTYGSHLPLKYRQYLSRANQKSLSFTLTVDEFNTILGARCVYCGSGSKITIDRVDSSCGYVLDNCQPCCLDCNLMKLNRSEEDFLRHVSNVYKYRLLR